MSTISDKEIKHFFESQKQPMADNGFSKRVMKQIPKPRRENHPLIVWGFGVIGFIIALFSGALINVVGSLAIFGRELSHARIPDFSPCMVYAVVLISMVGFTVNLFKKSWS
ncbi:MAG: DUF5056 domain-containing protein [Bacteroidales bacterium]